VKLSRFEKNRRNLMLKWIDGNDILDMGSNGTEQYKPNLHQFLKQNYENVIGIDRVKGADVDKVVDLNEKEYSLTSNSFDTIVAGEIIEHLDHPMLFLEECKRILKPDGRLIITTPNMNSITYILGIVKNIDKRHYHCHAWNIDLFDALVDRAGFKVIHKELFNNLASRDYILDLFTNIFSVFKTGLFYVLEKKGSD